MSFSALFESLTKDMAQRYGSTVKTFTLGFSLKVSGGLPIHVQRPGKNFGQRCQCNFFQGRPIRVGCPCLTDFFRIGQNSEKYILENLNVNNKI